MYKKIWSDDKLFLRYGAWQMQLLFLILGYFSPFIPLTAQKIKILKKWRKKKHLQISFYICVPKIMIRWCTVHKIWFMTDVTVISHFGLFFALFPLNSPNDQNFEKMIKTPGDIIILHMSTKVIVRWCTVPEIRCVTVVIIFHFRLFFALLPP